MTPLAKLAGLSCFLSLMCAFAFSQGTYQEIYVPGSQYTYCLGINSSGVVVGFFIDADGQEHAFFYQSGHYTTFDYPGADSTALAAINDNGQVVVDAPSGGFDRLFLYDLETGKETDISDPGAYYTIVLGMNNRGTVVGYGLVGYSFAGFQEDALGRVRNIRPPVSNAERATGITDDGVVYGYYYFANGFGESFRLVHNQYRQVHIPAGPYAVVSGVNFAGTAMIGLYSPIGNTDSFILQNGTLQTIAYPGARDTYAASVNNSAQVTGNFYYDTGPGRGFLWTPDPQK